MQIATFQQLQWYTCVKHIRSEAHPSWVVDFLHWNKRWIWVWDWNGWTQETQTLSKWFTKVFMINCSQNSFRKCSQMSKSSQTYINNVHNLHKCQRFTMFQCSRCQKMFTSVSVCLEWYLSFTETTFTRRPARLSYVPAASVISVECDLIDTPLQKLGKFCFTWPILDDLYIGPKKATQNMWKWAVST